MVYTIRKIILSFLSLIILIWAFGSNGLGGKIVITPFLICSFAFACENIFLLLHKKKISTIFKYIFRVCFFVYTFGFLLYAAYYAIVHKEYSLFTPILLFLVFTILLFKKAFSHNKR